MFAADAFDNVRIEILQARDEEVLESWAYDGDWPDGFGMVADLGPVFCCAEDGIGSESFCAFGDEVCFVAVDWGVVLEGDGIEEDRALLA